MAAVARTSLGRKALLFYAQLCPQSHAPYGVNKPGCWFPEADVAQPGTRKQEVGPAALRRCRTSKAVLTGDRRLNRSGQLWFLHVSNSAREHMPAHPHTLNHEKARKKKKSKGDSNKREGSKPSEAANDTHLPSVPVLVLPLEGGQKERGRTGKERKKSISPK